MSLADCRFIWSTQQLDGIVQPIELICERMDCDTTESHAGKADCVDLALTNIADGVAQYRSILCEGAMSFDPISTAVISYLSFAGTEAAKAAIRDLYDKLKNAIFTKAPAQQKDLEVALDGIQRDPDSGAYPMLLSESVKKANLESDAEVVTLAKAILAELQKSGSGSAGGVLTATGSYIAQADRGGSAQVHVGQPETKK
ncbi:hypothetical protein [Burkholderia stagnalis]|uniref:hypothetical protein n=1 Tax=Burkholderia stagnalis TaxID=1503054 RepID=UPI0012D98E67|nr:hypothetical protein [Burkholderia stagnalis]